MASYLLVDKMAIMEMASASGIIHLKKSELNPLITTTFGTGQMIKHALNSGVKKIIIGIGGSATNDCGLGMLEALGANYYCGDQLIKFNGAKDLGRVTRIDIENLDKRLAQVEFEVMCDVTNPLVGKSGATFVYGPQKGLHINMLQEVDQNMAIVGSMLNKIAKYPVIEIPGSGAAGGLGAALMSVLKAQLKPGVEVVLDIICFDKYIRNADLVITGEGQFDNQTKNGKVPIGVLSRCKDQNIPVIGIGGSIKKEAYDLTQEDFSALVSTVTSPISVEEAMRDAQINLENCISQVCSLLKLGMGFTQNRKV
jgi:glycerate kinase